MLQPIGLPRFACRKVKSRCLKSLPVPVAQQGMETLRMIAKLALLALALLIAWMALFRPQRGAAGPKRKPLPPPQALEPCPRCGIFRLPIGPCDCDPRSTSKD
jgi:hypothetical protein